MSVQGNGHRLVVQAIMIIISLLHWTHDLCCCTSTPYGAKYGQRGDVVTVVMNFDAGTIEFLKNGESQGR